MVEFVISLILLVLAMAAALAEKTFFYLPERELKRRAEAGREPSKTLWQAASYGGALKGFLWAVTVVCLAVGFVLISRVAPLFFDVVLVGLIIIYMLAWLPGTRRTSLSMRLARAAAPSMAWLMAKTHPAFLTLHKWVKFFADEPASGIFAREDLLDILEKQKSQPGNRITEEELNMAAAALEFGTKAVADILVERDRVKSVSADDKISPKLLDELHKTHHSHFPVYSRKKDNIVGNLLLGDFIEEPGKYDGRKVSELMQPRVSYLHEKDSLLDAVHEYYRRKHQLFVVVNSSNEYVGIITIKDIFGELLGAQIVEIHDEPTDRKATASRHGEAETEATT